MRKTLTFSLLVIVLLLSACGTKKINAPDDNIEVSKVSVRQIEIKGEEGIEYSIDGGVNWVVKNDTDEIVFTNLLPNTKYTILQRYISKDNKRTSLTSEFEVSTKALTEEDGNLDKILVLGNQLSKDALEYFYQIVDSNDIQENLIIGSVTYPTKDMKEWVSDFENKVLVDYKKDTAINNQDINDSLNLIEVISDEPWDMIIIEQTAGTAGILIEYTPHLNNLLDLIKLHTTNNNVEIAFQMPQAFSRDAEFEEYVNYRSDQIRMYNSIANRMEGSIISNHNIDVLIPTGTVVQNLRSTVIGDNLNIDSSLESNETGKLAAALTWVKQLYGLDLAALDLTQIEQDEDVIGAILESIKNAMLNPTELTRSTDYSNPYKDKLYMLSIGNSFTQDAYVYMAQMLLDIGIKDFVIGYLYVGGSSLNSHISRIENNSEYDQYRIWNNSTTMTEIKVDKTAARALAEYEWDIVTIQQVSSDSGVELSMRAISPLMDLIEERNPNHENTKYGYHMTWAYTAHWDFPKYNNDQLYMYNKIVEATQNAVVPHKDIDFVIPAGTAIQNLRNTTIGDNVTRDGYHLNGLGQFTAGMMWVKTLTNVDLDKITTYPVGVNVSTNIAYIKRAVEDTYYNPYQLS